MMDGAEIGAGTSSLRLGSDSVPHEKVARA